MDTIVSKAAKIRAQLDHPLIDGDSHIVEYTPVFLDYLKASGGNDIAERFGKTMGAGFSLSGDARKSWYAMSWEERREARLMRSPWWALPTKNTLDRCTAMLPKLYHARMDEVGLDFAVLYPSVGLMFNHNFGDDEFRTAACHAFNEYTAAIYGPYSDRMTVAAVIPLNTPEEGIKELEHAKKLGLKVAMIPAFIRRPFPDLHKKYPELAGRVNWLDSYGIDSDHDYDPFWAKCIELGFSVASHSAAQGLDDRRSISNYMYNHMGHFGAAGEVLAKSLVMGGVTRRFPKLRVACLEGGVMNGVRLYGDLFSRWEKRNLNSLQNLDPANIDQKLARELFEKYGDKATLAKLDQLEHALAFGPKAIDPDLRDDFAAMQITKEEDIRDLFIPHFYFGCEADDPLSAVAFDRRLHPLHEQVRAIMSFDLGHWDVTDMTHATTEAYEMVEEGLVSPEDFRTFAYGNSVQLYAGPNPDFFKGTIIEKQVAKELAAAKSR